MKKWGAILFKMKYLKKKNINRNELFASKFLHYHLLIFLLEKRQG